ncbi:MAG: hypothetical protein AMXMBFR82_31920 [Candidatus Hydrogenedentota bacterium]
MAGLGGVSPITFSVYAQSAVISALRPGQVAEGTVQANEKGLLLRIGNLDIPIEPVSGIQPGSRVSVELVRTNEGPQLRVTTVPTPPATTSSAPASTTAPPQLPAVLTSVLESLNRLDVIRQAVHLLPRDLPHNENAIRQVLSLYLARGQVGRDLAQITQLVRQAVDAGVIVERDISAVAAFLRLASSEGGDDALALLRRSTEQSGKPLEARLAAAVAAGKVDALLAELDQDVAVQLHRLRATDALRTFLRRAGRLADFDNAVDRTIDRFSAGHLQNLRAAEMPYHFLEVPFDPNAMNAQAQIHIFGEGGGKGKAFDPDNSTVVIDLATTNLGDLWISLNMTRGACQCWIRATDVDVVRAVEETAGELAGRLEASGYPGAQVHATLWDGNRIKEAANLLRRFEGISLEA